MRAVPLAVVLLLVAAFGLGGWFLGRASVDPVVQVVESGSRAESAPSPRPLLEPGRSYGGGRSGEPPARTKIVPTEPSAAAAKEPAQPEAAVAPAQPAGSIPLLARLGPEGWLQGLPQEPQEPAPPASPAVAEAQRLLLSSPEEAAPKIDALLDSRDAADRAAAYRMLADARHASQRPVVERAQREAKTEDEAKALLDALARFKGPKWNAVQITGPADTPLAGDLVTAWASKGPEMGEVWIDLGYAEAVSPEAVRVHETYNPGAVARVLAQRPDGTWATLWEGTSTPNPAPTWFEPRLETVRFTTQTIRLIVDTNRVEGWNEIDAVELLGDGKRQWAVKAQAGSNYTE